MAKAKKNSERPLTVWLAFAKIIEILADKFGWPGLLLVFVMYLISMRATDQEVHAIIDMYILGKGIGTLYPITVMGGLFVTAALAQRYSYRRKIKVMEKELVRMGGEKSSTQEKALGMPLHHSSVPDRSG